MVIKYHKLSLYEMVEVQLHAFLMLDVGQCSVLSGHFTTRGELAGWVPESVWIIWSRDISYWEPNPDITDVEPMACHYIH
jgi:hypothetical protein